MLELIADVIINAPIRRCFDVTRSIDAHRDSSTLIDGRPVAGKTTGLSEPGDETTWSARFFGVRFRIRTRITAMEAPVGFEERRIRGLVRRFEHDYSLEPTADGVRLRDILRVELPWGAAGRAAAVVLRPRLDAVQRHRLEWIRQTCEGDDWRRYVPS